MDRAVLAGFAELVQAAGAGPVADLGCGPGRVTAHLDALGLPAFGVDLSPEMVALARRHLPARTRNRCGFALLRVIGGNCLYRPS